MGVGMGSLTEAAVRRGNGLRRGRLSDLLRAFIKDVHSVIAWIHLGS